MDSTSPRAVASWYRPNPHSSRRRTTPAHYPKSPFGPTRRTFIKMATATSAGVALYAIGFIPTARPAVGHPPGGWTIWTNGGTHNCGGLGSWVNNDNCTGCDTEGNILCCCDSSGYHKDHQCHYQSRPDQCKSGGYDGWTWKYTGCCSNCRKNQIWRCTDGYYLSTCSAGIVLSICRWRTSSGSACSPC